MATLSKRERIDAALAGQPVDRAPVSAWRHFIPEERASATLAAATLADFHQFDWDWIKVNPRATYYAEAWGNTYDYAAYDGQALDYPVHALNWAAVGQDNPGIAEARARTARALIGGVDEAGAIVRRTPAEVEAEASVALAVGGPSKFLLAPGCGVAVSTPAANLHALRRAADLAAVGA